MKALSLPVFALVATVAFAGVDGWTVSTENWTNGHLPVKDGRLAFEFVPGTAPQNFSLRFEDGSDKPATLTFDTVGQSFLVKQPSGEKKKYDWADSGVRTSGLGEELRIYTRTLMEARFTDAQKASAVTNEAAYGEVASMHVFHFDLRRRIDGWELWIDRNFARKIPSKGEVKEVLLRVCHPSAKWRLVTPPKMSPDPLVERLPDVAPFAVAECKENLGSWGCECDGYRARCPFDGLRDCYLRRVPIGAYGKARVRCRLAGDTNKTTEVTARLTRFQFWNVHGRASNAMAQQTKTITRVPGQKVYEVEFDFDLGKIQDLVWMLGFEALDFEVLGGVKGGDYVAVCEDKPSDRKSDVVVLGAELERLPAGMCVRNGNYANLFYSDTETPNLTADVQARVAGTYKVAWRLTDVEGRKLEDSLDKVTLAAGASNRVTRTFGDRPPGWYGVKTVLADAKGRVLVRRQSSFVVLPPDTRKAGYESPYFAWMPVSIWYSNDEAKYAPTFDVVKRFGIRRGTVWWLSEEKLAKWGLTCNPSPVPSAWGMGIRYPDKKTRDAEYDKVTQDFAKRFPHADWALICHENYSGPVPLEAVGGVTKIDEKQAALDKLHAGYGNDLAEAWRRTRPDMKFMIGNSGNSLNTVGELLRGGLRHENINAIGDEQPGGPMPPEEVVAYNFYLLRELAKAYGCEARPGACYEWKFRPRRHFDSDRQLAAIGVRDALVAHTWRSPFITVWCAPEPGYSYYSTSWGCGALSREPLCQPYPEAASVCTLTRVLDCAQFVRLVDTGSKSVYCLEFERKDPHEFVYALWSAHGWTKGTLKTTCSKVLKTGCYGEERMTRGMLGLGSVTLETEVGEEPCYFTMEKPLVSIRVSTARRTYPLDIVPPLDAARPLALDLAHEDGWRTEAIGGPRIGTFFCRPIVNQPGDFRLRSVKDDEIGDALELELVPSKPLQSGLFGEFTMAALKEPVAIPADAHTLGVWVKGNSCGGKIYFMLQDANGVRWLTAGQAGGGRYDESGLMTINFDGWRLVPFPIAEGSPVRNHSLHMDLRQWMCVPPCPRDPKLTPPYRLYAVGASLKRETLVLNELQPSSSLTVRIGPAVTWGGKERK